MPTYTRTLIALAVGIGCVACVSDADPSVGFGFLEVRVDTDALVVADDVTRATVFIDNRAHSLPLDPATGTFVTTLALPEGIHFLAAQVFSAEVPVGKSELILIDVFAHALTRVGIRIQAPGFSSLPRRGPIIDFLVPPTALTVNSPALFQIQTLAAGDTVITYAWSSDCEDSTFGTP